MEDSIVLYYDYYMYYDIYIKAYVVVKVVLHEYYSRRY